MRNNKPIRILFAEDVATDLEMALRYIRRENIGFEHVAVDNEADFRRELIEFEPDIVITDYSMPAFNGMKALQITKDHFLYVPVILLTGSRNEEIAVECMKAGANDYVIKEHINRLPFAILEAIERKIAKLEKRSALEQLKLLSRSVEQSPVSIVITNKEGTIEYVNPTFSRVSGYGKEVIGQNPRILKSGEQSDKFYKHLWETILSGQDWSGEIRNKRKDGSFFWESVIISPILNKKGEITHFVGVKEDITERKKMISELISAKERAEEGDRLKSAFLANMSHEIRTPMNGILGFLELLQKEGLAEEERETYTDVVKKSSERMLQTINDLIEISKIESSQTPLQFSRISSGEMLEHFYNFFKYEAEQKQLELRVGERLPEASDMIITDKRKLESIVSNLVRNALKFTKSGFVAFGFRLKAAHELEFFVEDSGIGIPEDKLDAVFKRFVQADMGMTRTHEGSGLGLSIAKGYTEMLGGSVSVISDEGKGTVFTVTLPLITDEAGLTESNDGFITGYEGSVAEPGTILVAEDDPFSFTFLEVVLKKANYTVLHAEDGEQAVNMFKENPGIRMILMDMKMPVMDGLEATRRIREIDSDVCIIAQTGYAMWGDREKVLSAGCNDYITKPISPSSLLSRMKALLENR